MIATNEQKDNWFYRPDETKEDYARDFAENNSSVFIDTDGIVKCRKCKAPRMFLLEGMHSGVYCHKWLPIACKCKDGKETQGKLKTCQLKLFDGDNPF